VRENNVSERKRKSQGTAGCLAVPTNGDKVRFESSGEAVWGLDPSLHTTNRRVLKGVRRKNHEGESQKEPGTSWGDAHRDALCALPKEGRELRRTKREGAIVLLAAKASLVQEEIERKSI